MKIEEELRQKAEEWLCKNWTPYDFYDTECNVYNDDIKEDLIEAYLAGAIENDKEKVTDLEKELNYAKTHCLFHSDCSNQKQLAKAKEYLNLILMDSPDVYRITGKTIPKILAEVKQFLRETEEDG